MSDNLPSHVYGVIIDLVDDTLILPNSAVLEVMGHDALQGQAQGPDWLLGKVTLELDDIPVLSLERLWGRALPEQGRRSRIVILKAPNRDDRIAIMAQSYPLIVTLNEVALKALPEQDDDESRNYVLSHVQVANRQAWIPDIDALVFASHAEAI